MAKIRSPKLTFLVYKKSSDFYNIAIEVSIQSDRYTTDTDFSPQYVACHLNQATQANSAPSPPCCHAKFDVI
eukprot:scaffold406492_cov14-Prasinocladus_malaysianus.AAC.1